MGGYNPTVALGINPAMQQQNTINPLEIANSLVNIQKGQNEIQIQRNTIAARNGLSDLIASTPPDQLAARLAASPFSAWFPDLAETYTRMDQMRAQTRLAGAETERAQAQTSQIGQQIGDTALEHAGQLMPTLMVSPPDQWNDKIAAAREQVMATTPDAQKASVGQGFDSMVRGLMVGVDPTDPNAPNILNRNVIGTSGRFGLKPDDFSVQSGGTMHMGPDGRMYFQKFGSTTMTPMAPSGGLGTITPFVPVGPGGISTTPGAGGGVMGTTAPPPLGSGPGSLGQQPAPQPAPQVAPQPQQPAAQPAPAPAPAPQPAPQPQQPAAPPPAVQPQPTVQQPATARPAVGPPNASGPGVSAPVTANGITYAMSDGKPLYTGSLAGRAKTPPANINPTTNTASYDTGVQAQITAANEHFANVDQPRFDQLSQTLAQTEQIRSATRNLSAVGGLATPGAHMDQRMALVNGYNTLRTILGDQSETPELSAEASFVELHKQISNLASSTVMQNFPGGREAVAYLNNAMRSVPGVNNTAMSIQLLNRTIEATAQRQADEYRYIQDWSAGNHGNIIDARAAFAAEHPVNEMMDKVLSEFGLGPRGWTGATGAETRQNIVNAYKNHLVSWDQASDALNGKPMRGMTEGQQ